MGNFQQLTLIALYSLSGTIHNERMLIVAGLQSHCLCKQCWYAENSKLFQKLSRANKKDILTKVVLMKIYKDS